MSAGLVLGLVVLGVGSPPDETRWGQPPVTGLIEIAQCRFHTGDRVVLLRPGGQSPYEMHLVEGGRFEDSSQIWEEGEVLRIETNGGVASLNAIGQLFRELREHDFVPLSAEQLPATLRTTSARLCTNAYKDGRR